MRLSVFVPENTETSEHDVTHHVADKNEYDFKSHDLTKFYDGGGVSITGLTAHQVIIHQVSYVYQFTQ